ncbi:double-strand break repair protein AddB [Zavarzinia compransoris]|uniref:double-strand break repair protein AddB n=1 Tax=Zavarzinia compransoris TaxID=1264899 RepID=UPI0010F2D9A0|nr:double-strand break repair protein AddB [Zavarzinia compransoris]TDP40439.1 ATP-dependent helicase/nuclease subunit B [Zavarzinia compransoris]
MPAPFERLDPSRLPPVTGRPRLFTIPAGQSFVDTLADTLLDRAGADPLDLAATLILVPTRRAARSLREAFLRRSRGRAVLLPRLRPLGDADEEELTLAGREDTLDLPPAIEPLARKFLLARLVMGWWRARGEAADLGAAVAHAGELARLIDEMETEGADWAALDGVVPDALAGHWQATLDFLKIAARDYWPEIRDAHGAMDPASRRNQLLLLQAEQWRAAPPAHPVIVAGSTGSIPATAHLMSVVARLPRGAVILPGFDAAMSDDDWQKLDPGHPQWTMREVLERLRADRAEVGLWPGGGPVPAPGPRQALLAEALAPAVTTERWSATSRDLDLDAALAGVTRIDAADSPAEARAIALLMRGQLEQPGQTAMLVTPDRKLARRVAAELSRWSVEVDDSAGTALAASVPGAFLRLVLAMVAGGFAPLDLLACLKHPLAALGLPRGDMLRALRRLERRVLRGIRPAPGLASLRAIAREEEVPAGVLDLIDRLEDACAALARALAGGTGDLAGMVTAHITAAEQVAATDAAPGAEALWRGDAGEAAAGLVQDMLAAAATLGPVPARDYAGLFETLAGAVTVRPSHGLHPRLRILGPQEARLEAADLVILGGLNEGGWPAEPPADPWASRAMRRDLGLPPLEKRLGQAAHDFATLAAAPRVVLTRATKVDLSPTVPSRWLRRLEALVPRGLWQAGPAPGWALSLDPPEGAPWPEPAPRPPVEARPVTFSVSDIELLVRDPYALYAKRVLRLRPLDPIDAPPGAADRGNIIHDVLDSFLGGALRGPLPPDAVERLEAIGEAAFARYSDRPAVRSFWWPRFRAVARWFVAVEDQRRLMGIVTLAVETEGALSIVAGGREHRITARADRIDGRPDGYAVVIDYKTGTPPTKSQMQAGYRPQLPLEGAMIARGGFPAVAARPVGGIEVWQLKGGRPPGRIAAIADGDTDSLVEQALEGVARLLARYADRAQPYLATPNPKQAAYGDYDHLARVGEWGQGEGGA